MKTRLLLATALFCSGLAQAQTQKGNGILGGGIRLGYSQQRREQPSINNTGIPVSFNVTVGKFVADNWMAGLEGNYKGQFNGYRIEDGQNIKNRNRGNSPSATPFVRRYWSVGPVLLFAGTGLRFTYSATDDDTKQNNLTNSESHQKTYLISPTFMVGGNYHLSNRLSLQGMISASELPIPASYVGLGLVYWTGPTGTGATNPETQLTTTQQGNWLIEGGFDVIGNSYRNSNSQRPAFSENSDVFALSTSVGHFIADNLLLGVGFGFSSINTKRTGNGTADPNRQTYSVSPYVQRYYGSLRLRPYVRGAIVFSSDRTVGQDPVTPVQATIGAGLSYLISNRFLIETTLGTASYSFVDYGSGNRRHALDLSAQLGSGFSLRYVIAGQK